MTLYCPECNETYADETMSVCPTDGTRLYVVQDDDIDALIGSVIDGRFRIDHTLGIGGMGTVYRGVQLSVNRPVAIKVLRTELSSREVALERFFREAKTISQLSHPNIVKLIDFGQDRDRGLLYLVMELVNGHNLADLIARGRLRMALALEVAYQVCGALTEPHARGVIHRDLKPDNLLLVPISDGTVQAKVLDFGIARALESNTKLTGTGMICGTPAYMAPEQAQNEQLDPRTDLYGLGVILYEMLSGWPPFSGTSSLQIMLKHIQEVPTPLRDLLPPATLPPDVENLVYDMMSKDRAERPTTAREIRDRIEHIRRSMGLEAVRVDFESDANTIFHDWLLPKLPVGEKHESGPTEVLRRETGMEEWLTAIEDDQPTRVFGPSTETDLAVKPTGPMTPEKKAEIAAEDRRVKVSTRRGAHQAWTPGDREALGKIKSTKEGIDVHGPTIDAEAFHQAVQEEDTDGPRKTMVEPERAEERVEPVATDETEAAQVASHPPAETAERASAGGITGLVLVAVALCVVAVATGGFVIFQLMQPPPATPAPSKTVKKTPTPAPQTTPPASVVPALDRASARIEVARSRGVVAATAASRERTATHHTTPVDKPHHATRPHHATTHAHGAQASADAPKEHQHGKKGPKSTTDGAHGSQNGAVDGDALIEGELKGMPE